MKNRSIVVQMIGKTTTTTPTISAYTRQHMHTEEYDEDYEDERATEYKAILDEEDTLLHHSTWKSNATLIDIPGSPSIDTQPPQRNRKRASTDAEVNRVREGDYSIGSWADDHHHESYAVETAIYEPGGDELHEGFTYEELLNMQRQDETAQHQSETAWGRTRYTHPIDRAHRPSININPSTSIDINPLTWIDIRSKPITTTFELAFQCHRFEVNQHPVPEVMPVLLNSVQSASQKEVVEDMKDCRSITQHWCRLTVMPEYGLSGYARDLYGNTIRLHNMEIRKLMERASRDEPSYISLPEHGNLFTQTKLAPEIYTKDEINEMFYGVCGEQEKNKEAFQMKLDGVYYPLNESISWLTTFMEEMNQDIARIQHATDVA
ncbi:hypothetical protein F2Q69_00036373 [Brassica cretica]|uniref:Uncharacterized protein n=1 Tax=Brassica cretica TaxID=69181 RepID=A0A8S9SM56_BRACR|nr:hypothetical protein F2Q69_00036373 [Brassica cretica]